MNVVITHEEGDKQGELKDILGLVHLIVDGKVEAPHATRKNFINKVSLPEGRSDEQGLFATWKNQVAKHGIEAGHK